MRPFASASRLLIDVTPVGGTPISRTCRTVVTDRSTTVVGYVRVSTEEQGDSGAGLEAQRRAIHAACEARGWAVEAVHEDVASGKSLEHRPGLVAALEAVQSRRASGLVVAKLDRLSRSVVDAAQTMERARREGWNLVALDLGVDFSTPNGEVLAHIVAAIAQFERRLIGQRTKDALAVKRSQGVRLGRPPVADAAVEARVMALHREGRSAVAIAELLSEEGVKTPRGGSRWFPSTVVRMIRRLGGSPGRRGRQTHPRIATVLTSSGA